MCERHGSGLAYLRSSSPTRSSRIETGDRIVADYELQYLADALETSILNLLGIE